MTRSKSKKGHANIGSAVKPKLTVKHASESASEDDLTEHKLSPEDVAQATRPSTESAKYTELSELPSSKDNHHSLGCELPQSSNQVSQERNAYQQPTGSSGVPQGSIQGPPISKSPACFELNVLLQGLQDVKWTPSKPIKDIDARGDIMTMKDYAKDFYAYLQMVEKKCVCPADYLCSPEPGMPTSSMRSVLLDWLMQVQHEVCVAGLAYASTCMSVCLS
ncbi:uncharacterized protein [Amphiura filiformis]|uniref:uncharacterized protein n=1 Tax=Amphiura filiformis TaxID=82378 RepID=UPI003B21C1CE